jgi:hypothetical protein
LDVIPFKALPFLSDTNEYAMAPYLQIFDISLMSDDVLPIPALPARDVTDLTTLLMSDEPALLLTALLIVEPPILERTLFAPDVNELINPLLDDIADLSMELLDILDNPAELASLDRSPLLKFFSRLSLLLPLILILPIEESVRLVMKPGLSVIAF